MFNLKRTYSTLFFAFLVFIFTSPSSAPQELEVPIFPLRLRSEPVDSLNIEDIEKMVKEKGFYDGRYNVSVKGISHLYEEKLINDEVIIIDHTTGLTWQQSGSPDEMLYKNVSSYIDSLNLVHYAGYSDWRLPTIEEAMSLMRPMTKRNYFSDYISTIFDIMKHCIWTSDRFGKSRAWVVDYSFGTCWDRNVGILINEENYVRVVRSGR